MRLISLLSAIAVVACILGYIPLCGCADCGRSGISGETIRLPAPSHDSNTSIEQALSQRRSVREFRDEPCSLSEVSQLLWAAQGLTGTDGAGRRRPQGRYIRLKSTLSQGTSEA